MDENVIKECWTTILKEIGEDPNREGLIDTPKRVAKMYKELFRGYDKKQIPKVTTFMNGVDGFKIDEMIKDTGNFNSTCEHHVIPFMGQYFFAYIPHPNGKILGLSKVARIIDYFGARLQIQERLVEQIVKHIYNELCKDTEYKPLGVALVMEAEHLCKTMRGVKKKGKMETTKLIGAFKEDASARAEFLGWVNRK